MKHHTKPVVMKCVLDSTPEIELTLFLGGRPELRVDMTFDDGVRRVWYADNRRTLRRLANEILAAMDNPPPESP